MSLLIFAIIVLVLTALAVWAVDLIPIETPPPVKPLIKILVVVIAFLTIAARAQVV